jgi:hypothetical protein
MPRHFSNWLRAYIQHTRDTESPTIFHFWTGVWTIAGALRRRVWIDMRKFQWTPNFYIIMVGPPGIVAKSTTANIGVNLLSKVPGIKFGPQSATWQAMTKSLEEAIEYVKVSEDESVKPIPMSAISMAVSELGTFLKMDDRVLGDVMISLWDGQIGEWGHDTKTTGNTKITNPWVNLIGCTTPTWLAENFPKAMIGGGLTSRIIFIYGDTKREFIPYPDEIIPGREYYEFQEKLIDDLTQISMMVGEYKLHPDAREWGRNWYTRLWQNRPIHMASDKYSGYIARKQTHMHKLAIVLAAAKRNDLLIHPDDLIEADQILTDVEPHMLKVFESVGVVDEAQHVAELIPYVRAYKWITAKDLYQCVFKTMSEAAFKQSLRIAIEGDIFQITQQNGVRGLSLAPRLHQ